MGDLTFTAQAVYLYPGDLLLSVTDGITERRGLHGRLLDDDDGVAGLLSRCGGLNAGAVAARIQRAAEDAANRSQPSVSVGPCRIARQQAVQTRTSVSLDINRNRSTR